MAALVLTVAAALLLLGIPPSGSAPRACPSKALLPLKNRVLMGQLLEQEGFTAGAELGVQASGGRACSAARRTGRALPSPTSSFNLTPASCAAPCLRTPSGEDRSAFSPPAALLQKAFFANQTLSSWPSCRKYLLVDIWAQVPWGCPGALGLPRGCLRAAGRRVLLPQQRAMT